MKKFGVFITAILLSVGAAAKPVKTFDKAEDLVIKSVQKNHLLPVSLECVSFLSIGEDKQYFYIDIRENHNERCGGDPHTSPRLMTYQVHKKTGNLCTDSVEWAERLKADDPYNFECRAIR